MCRGSAGCAGAGAASNCHPDGLNLLKQRYPDGLTSSGARDA